jgi:endonuclease/exonuclease/phosphatase family metal-dependent hydrolase
MLRVAVANMTWQQGHDRWLIRSLCNDHDILLLQETKNLDLNALLPDGWRGFIEGPYGSGRREPAFAIRRSRVTVVNSGGLVYAAETSNPGPDRYIRWARFADPAGNVGHFITCHYPLRRDERNQNHMDNVLRNHLGNVPNDMPVIFGGDVNQARGPFANRFNMDRYPGSAAAAGIMLLGTKRVYDVTRAGMLPDGKGRDHTIPFARIWMARG